MLKIDNIFYITEEFAYDKEDFKLLSKLTVDNQILEKMELDIVNETYGSSEKFKPFEVKEKTIKSKFVGCLFLDNGEKIVSLPKYTEYINEVTGINKTSFTKEQKITEIKKNHDIIIKLFQIYKKPLSIKDPLFEFCTNELKSEIGFADIFFTYYCNFGLFFKNSKHDNLKKGRTSWGKTTKKITPDLINGFPIYRKTIKETYFAENVDISEIQKSILNYLIIDKEYAKFLGYNIEPQESAYDFNDIKNNRHIIDLLIAEKQNCFNDNDIYLLDLMIQFLDDDYNTQSKFKNNIYGIIKFEALFESILLDYFKGKNGLRRLKNGRVEVYLNSEYTANNIPDINDAYAKKIEWTFFTKSKKKVKEKTRISNKGIYIPDIIFEYQDGDNKYGVIIDAKYYDFYSDINGEIENYPDAHNVIKQVQYIDILDSIYKDNGLTDIILENVFILPWKKYYGREYNINNESKLHYIGQVKFRDNIIHVFLIDIDTVINKLLSNNISPKNNQKYLLDKIKEYKNEQNSKGG